MKKLYFVLIAILGVANIGLSQNYDVLYVGHFNARFYCANDDNLTGVIIHGEDNCDNQTWYVTVLNSFGEETVFIDEQNIDSIIIPTPHEWAIYNLSYNGCEINCYSGICFEITYTNENPFVEPIIWKRKNELTEIETVHSSPNTMFTWSTGETGRTITVDEPGIYSVTLSDDCGSATYSVEVRDNVELYRATVDLRTNKNKVTWLATPEQAEYITEVKVYRDGNLVGTAPYANGYFLDAIGSDAAARTYQIVGVSVEGDDCPIASYQKGTIHTTYYLDVNNDLNMTWNAPYIQEEAEGQLTGYQIYKYNPATEELTLIDEVNATITNYTCSANAFVGGRAILAATFDRVSPPSGGDGQRPEGAESRSFSNPSENMFAVSEETLVNFKVYPNPTNGAFTIEGVKDVTVYNTLGQAVASSRSEEGTHTFTLQTGIYFVKSNEDVVKKVVVE